VPLPPGYESRRLLRRRCHGGRSQRLCLRATATARGRHPP